VFAGRGHGAPLGMTIAWIAVVPACTLAALWVSQPGRLERLEDLGGDRERPKRFRLLAWSRWLWDKAKLGLADAIGGVGLVRHMVTHPRRHAGGLLGFPIYWFGDLVTLYAALRAFGAHVDAAPLVLAYTTAYVLTALPLPAGGAGSIEAALAFALHAVGIPLAPALLAAFVYRIFAFWLPILPAVALLPTVKRLNEELPKAEPQPAPS
jgi:uncharacterized membrane protein YbhN (UPF0104 family)